MMKKHLAKVATVLAVCAPMVVHADIVILQDGTQLEGRVEQSANSPDRISFISGTNRLELPRTRVREIIEESDAQDFTRLGDQLLKAKSLTTALQNYERALQADPNFEAARAGLQATQEALAQQQAEREREVTEAFAKQLENIPGLIKGEKYEEAEQMLNTIMASPITEQQQVTAQRLMRDLYLAWGFSRYDRLDYKGAEERYLRVQEMDPDNKEARDRLLDIWRNDPSKREEVLRQYESKLRDEPNNLEYNQRVGDLYYSAQRFEEAIGPLTKVAASPRYAGQRYDVKLLNAYRGAITAARDAQNFEKAIGLYERMLQAYPTQDTTELIVLRYQSERNRLASDDWQGRAQLVQRLQDAGLTQLAAREAELILRYDPENERAIAILRQQATAELQRIQQAMSSGDFLVARDIATSFLRTQNRFPDLMTSAQEMFAKADIEAKRQERAAREQARQIAERGLQYYQEALQNVAMINSTEVRTGPGPISYKATATNLSRRAIEHFQTALRIDPSLGGIDGMDLNARLRDAQALYNGLTDTGTRLPTVRNR